MSLAATGLTRGLESPAGGVQWNQGIPRPCSSPPALSGFQPADTAHTTHLISVFAAQPVGRLSGYKTASERQDWPHCQRLPQ